MGSVTNTTPKKRICACCASWFGGSRVYDKGMVRYDASHHNTGKCTHPLSSKKNQLTTPNFTCSRWTQAFS